MKIYIKDACAAWQAAADHATLNRADSYRLYERLGNLAAVGPQLVMAGSII